MADSFLWPIPPRAPQVFITKSCVFCFQHGFFSSIGTIEAGLPVSPVTISKSQLMAEQMVTVSVVRCWGQ